MTINHTPGPWVKSGQSEGGRYIKVTAGYGRTVARVPFSPSEGEWHDDHDANLIAAAPEMLALIKKMANDGHLALLKADAITLLKRLEGNA